MVNGAVQWVRCDVDGRPVAEDGLSDLALAVYALLRRRSGTSLAEACQALGLRLTAAERAFDELRAARLVWPGVDGELLVADPYNALERLADEHRQSLLSQQRDVERMRWAQHSIIKALHDVRMRWDDPGEVERLRPGPATLKRLRQLVAGGHGNLYAVCPTELLSAANRPAADDIYRLCLSRPQTSVLVQRSMLADAQTYEALGELNAHGLQLRVLETAPLPFAVIDDAVAIAGIPEADVIVPVVFHRHVAAGILRAVFEHLWSGGALLPTGHSTRVREPASAAELSAQQRHVLRLLAGGAKDEAIARQLGVSLRTVRRIVAETMERLGVQSRFQAGLAVARRGLLDCPVPPGGGPSVEPAPEGDA